MTLGQKIQVLREQQKLSQKELAGMIGVTVGTIAEWEADEAAPNLALLAKLSKALSVPSDALLDTVIEADSEETPAPTQAAQNSEVHIAPSKKNVRKLALIIGIAAALCLLCLFLSPTFSENSAAIARADASVVTIFCYDHEGELSATGSGFIAFNEKTVITNYHVMTSAYSCKISTNQDISYEVSKILCYSKAQDIAILQLAKSTGLKPLSLGNSTDINKGETVVAIGSPLGIKNTVSTGVLSGRLIEDSMDVLQFTAPISSGSSGGALFDNNGQVIGITYASFVDGQNLNLAVPIELATSLYKNKGNAKQVSAIYFEKHPHIGYLEAHNDIPEVTLTDLKSNPKKYDGKIVKLTAYVSSFHSDPDGEWEFSYLYLSNKNDVTYDYEYDFRLSVVPQTDFQNIPSIRCEQYQCTPPSTAIEEGTRIVVIAEFDYHEKGEEINPGADKYWWLEGVYEYNTAYINALYVYMDP